ncbi:MAG: mechanosensitive ion channel family protein [Rhizobiales bacterium]|nr:mechanosensitive ion channel family protein [Hyphomicrobiales bacterium]
MTFHLASLCARALAVLVVLATISGTTASAQMFGAGSAPAAEQPIEIPKELTPELVDGMLSRLTDGQIRELLHSELIRRADEQAKASETEVDTFAGIEARLAQMAERIETRVVRWAGALADLGSRRDKVDERMALAEHGIFGMIASWLILVAAGVVAALAVSAGTQKWRRWLETVEDCGYWDKVVRTFALGVIEFLPIIAFVAVTRSAAPFMQSALGPLVGLVWIYHAGVSYSWAFIVLSRRAFAPDAPQIRIAPLEDNVAQGIHTLLRRAVWIGVAGWLIGGFFPNIGLGFPPAMVTVALAGTAVAALLMAAVIGNLGRIRAAAASVFDARPEAGSFARIMVTSAPVVLALYLLGAWFYWLAHWLERGQHRLEGPLGTLMVLLVLPIFDRMGGELVNTAVRSDTEAAERFRGVFHGAWRVVIGIAAILVISGLWNLDVVRLAKGENAPAWADTGFDIVVTLLIGYLIWRLIRASLHTEKHVAGGAEDADPSSVSAASRLHTLTPLFRNMLLGFLAIIVTMIVLSSFGVDIGPLLASAGIVGIAVGFGAQTLVRDIFSGIFFLVDDAFRVGEYIELDSDLRGEVESISIRSLQLRHHRGAVITIPFGELKQITNHNRDWVIYKMSFRLEPDTDPQKVKKVVKRVGAEFLEHPEHGAKFLDPLKSQGVYYIDDDSALVIRVKFRCRPRAQFVLRREIYHRLQAVFAEEGIHFARRKVEVVSAEGEPLSEEAKASVADELTAAPSAAAPSGASAI